MTELTAIFYCYLLLMKLHKYKEETNYPAVKMPVLLFWFSSVTENSYEYSYGSVLPKPALVDAAYLGASQGEHNCSLLQATKMPWMYCLMTDTWTKFNAEFMKFGTKLRLKNCQSWNHNFLYGTLRNIENIAQGFKHYLKVMFFHLRITGITFPACTDSW